MAEDRVTSIAAGILAMPVSQAGQRDRNRGSGVGRGGRRVCLRWFPVGGFGETLPDQLYHLFLPALTLALSLSAVLMRNLRASIIEVLGASMSTSPGPKAYGRGS